MVWLVRQTSKGFSAGGKYVEAQRELCHVTEFSA